MTNFAQRNLRLREDVNATALQRAHEEGITRDKYVARVLMSAFEGEEPRNLPRLVPVRPIITDTVWERAQVAARADGVTVSTLLARLITEDT